MVSQVASHIFWFSKHKNPNPISDFYYIFRRTPFHVDVFTSYSWSVNICGEKKWILFPPGEERKLKNKFGNLPHDVSYLEDPNNNEGNGNLKFILVIQNVGDAIFVPSGWHHQVWNTVSHQNFFNVQTL